jgi:hypothetical protein
MLVLSGDALTQAVEIPLTVGEPLLARVLTGVVCSAAGADRELGRVDLPGLAVSASIRPAPRPRRPGRPASHQLTLTPRVLTDEGVVPSWIGYSTEAGVVCVTPHASESFVVREDGSIARHLAWPRPITAELPLGRDGAVAWSVGGPGSDAIECCVMHRHGRDDEPTIDIVPMRPSRGVWWRGRVFWTCVPLGVASWAPGEALRFSLPDLSVAFMQPGQDGLLVVPRVRGADGGIRRCLLRQGWMWDGGSVIESAAIGPDGVVTSTSQADDWTASAHLEADLVRLTSSEGASVALACYRPVRVAWAGRSLFVGTWDHEIILFERLRDRLESRPA